MPLPNWPDALPALVGILGNTGTAALYPAPRETEMDDGPGRARRQYLSTHTDRTYVDLWTRAQLVAFQAFMDGAGNGGQARFTAPVRLPSGVLGSRTCRIVGPVAEADVGPKVRVSFTIRIWNWRG